MFTLLKEAVRRRDLLKREIHQLEAFVEMAEELRKLEIPKHHGQNVIPFPITRRRNRPRLFSDT